MNDASLENLKSVRSQGGWSTWILFLSLTPCFFAGCSSQAAVPNDPLIMRPEEVVENFYDWLMEYPGNPRVDGAYKTSPFLTDVYIEQVGKGFNENQIGGVDPFMCAQDIPEKVFVHDAETMGKHAFVNVDSSFPGHHFQIELELVEGEWKIRNILCGR
jgi:hypothetical protein